jgi:hypothetical protein
MIAGGNWWRANEIVMSHLSRQAETHYGFRDNTDQRAVADVCHVLAIRPAHASHNFAVDLEL